MNYWTFRWIPSRPILRESVWRFCQRRSTVGRATQKQYFSSHKPTSPPTSITVSAQDTAKQQRFDRFLNRTPKFLRRHVSALGNAPVTHITAFLLLHELTAVIPLFGLAGAFHYYHWLPPYFAEGAWVLKGVEMFGRYFRRKGWIAAEDEQEVEREARAGEDLTRVEKQSGIKDSAGKWFSKGEGGTRLVVEFATAYAIVKVLMPARLIISAYGAPWFANWTVIPMSNLIKRLFRRRGKSSVL